MTGVTARCRIADLKTSVSRNRNHWLASLSGAEAAGFKRFKGNFRLNTFGRRTGADSNAIATNPLILFLGGRGGRGGQDGRTISIRILKGVSVVGFEGVQRPRNRAGSLL